MIYQVWLVFGNGHQMRLTQTPHLAHASRLADFYSCYPHNRVQIRAFHKGRACWASEVNG